MKKGRQRELLSSSMPTVMNWRSSYKISNSNHHYLDEFIKGLTDCIAGKDAWIHLQTNYKKVRPRKGEKCRAIGGKISSKRKKSSLIRDRIRFSSFDRCHTRDGATFHSGKGVFRLKKKDKWLWKCHLRWKRDMTDYMKCLHPFLTGLLLPGCVMWGVIGEGRREIARAII